MIKLIIFARDPEKYGPAAARADVNLIRPSANQLANQENGSLAKGLLSDFVSNDTSRILSTLRFNIISISYLKNYKLKL